jgi:hypothetical protein
MKEGGKSIRLISPSGVQTGNTLLQFTGSVNSPVPSQDTVSFIQLVKLLARYQSMKFLDKVL